MAIYKRGRIWWISYLDQNRRRVFESSSSGSRAEAARLLAERQVDISRGQYRATEGPGLKEFAERYMVYAKANKSSWDRDAAMLKNILGFFGDRKLHEVSALEIEEYKSHRCSLVEKSTVNRELSLLKHLFNLAIAWDLFSRINPLRKVRFFREDNEQLRILSPEEEDRLLREASGDVGDVARFAIHTGMRIGEIFRLRWSDVDMANRILSVHATKTGKLRRVPLNEVTERILQFWLLGRRNEYVFYNRETGGPFRDLKAGFQRACRKADISGVTWHTLRHTFASRLVSRGVDIVTVKELLGHSTVSVTMRYAHTNMASKRDAVRSLVPSCDNLVTMPRKEPRGPSIVTAQVV